MRKWSLIFYFIILGAINLIVAYTLSESAWLQFKVFGNLVITFIFVIGQMPMLIKYIEVPEEVEQNPTDGNGKEPI